MKILEVLLGVSVLANAGLLYLVLHYQKAEGVARRVASEVWGYYHDAVSELKKVKDEFIRHKTPAESQGKE